MFRDTESEDLTYFFWIPVVLPSGASNTLEVFVAIVAAKDLTFIWNLFAANRHGIFEDASCTLFRVRSLVSGVVRGQDDVSAFGDIFREHNELKEKCEALEQENSIAKNELVELWIKDRLAYSLYEKVNRYSSPSVLAAQIMELKVSLAEGEKRWNKDSEDVGHMFCEFKED